MNRTHAKVGEERGCGSYGGKVGNRKIHSDTPNSENEEQNASLLKMGIGRLRLYKITQR